MGSRRDRFRPLNTRRKSTVSSRGRARVHYSQARKMYRTTHIQRGIRQSRVYYVTAEKLRRRRERRQGWSGWTKSTGWMSTDFINFISLIGLLATTVFLWLVFRQMYGGEP